MTQYGSLPLALAEGKPSLSFGCVGMRINTATSEDLMLMVVPRNLLENMRADLTNLGQVHQQMEQHYLERITSLGLPGPEEAWG